ncbi:MAG TPA: hypothetical protein VH637_06800 [Streptosporangiaceae bacterium]
MISVAVVDDDQMLDTITAWLRSAEGIWLSATAHAIDELFVAGDMADVVVLSLSLADRSDPVRNVRRLVAAGCRVLALGAAVSAELGRRVVTAGASGCLTKDRDLHTLVAAVRQAARESARPDPAAGPEAGPDQGGARPRLSPQERIILIAYASGMTLEAAARRAGVRPVTAKNYLARVKEKYRLAGRPTFTKLDLAARVREDGLAG